MPTIILIHGWRFFFFANEGNEPIHIHCRKSEKDIKYWIDIENSDIKEAYSYNTTPPDIRFIKKVIFENFDYIVEKWQEFEAKKR